MRVLSDIITDTTTNVVTEQASETLDTQHILFLDFVATITANNPSNPTFQQADVDTDADSVDVGTALPTGTRISELTSTGTLPAGLATSTVYYAVDNGDGTNSFATSRANALAGTLVDITDTGSVGATHTIVVDTTLAGTIKLQKNLEPLGVNIDPIWVDVDDDEVLNGNASLSYSAAGNLNWVMRDIAFHSVRALITNTSGTINVALRVNGKGA